MKSTIIFLCIAVFFNLVQTAQEVDDSTTLIKAGAQPPAFSLKTLDGKTFNSKEFQGKVILVNFWATWCPPCKQEMPLLQKDVFDAFKDQGLVMIAISRGEKEETVQKFIADNTYTFPIGLDTEKAIYQLFATQYIPRNFVIGKDGIVKLASIGYEEEDFKAMIELIREELKK